MPFWQWIKSNIPPYAEEITINQVQETLSKFSQPKPSNNFIQIETEYLLSTKPKWTKPLSERYGFTYEGEWFQIDIPHTIMESLELKKGGGIIESFCLDPKVLKRTPTYGGIDIEKEEEIFLEKPFTIRNLDKDINKLLERIKELEKEKERLENKNEALENKLEKEQKWWEKWINDTKNLDQTNQINHDNEIYRKTTLIREDWNYRDYNVILWKVPISSSSSHSISEILLFREDWNHENNDNPYSLKVDIKSSFLNNPQKTLKLVIKVIHDYYLKNE